MPLSPVIEKPLDFIAHCLTKIEFAVEIDGKMKTIPLITKGEYSSLKALTGYCKREGFFGAIATLIHRIWNAAKAIFGQSDWQVAQRTFVTHVKRSDAFMGIETPQSDEDLKIQANVLMQDVVEKLNDMNKNLKVVENILVPHIETLLTSFDMTKIPHDRMSALNFVEQVKACKTEGQIGLLVLSMIKPEDRETVAVTIMNVFKAIMLSMK